MKILEVVHRFPPALGGSEKVVYELSKEFIQQGHDVTVLTSTSLNNIDTRGFSTGRRFTLRSSTYKKKKEIMDGIRVIRCEPDFQFWTFAINREMKHFLKKNLNNYDIIHVHGYQAYESYIVSKLTENYVHTAHDIIAHYPGLFAFIKKIYDILFGKRILKKAKALIALTPENVTQYNEILHCTGKTQIIPNGITVLKKKGKNSKVLKQLGNPQHVILFVGRIVEYKGCQYTIQALPDILKEYPSAIALFVGKDDGYTEHLKKIATEFGVQKQCHFTGAVDDLESYLNLGDVFVFPSRGEGFGLAPVEAMSVGIPVILANMGGLKYVLQKIGGTPIDMNKNIPEQITRTVLEIFADKNIQKKMKPIVEETQKYRWEHIAKRTLQVFKK